MAVNLPLRNDAALFSFDCQLDGTTYLFAFRWNERDAQWLFDLSDVDRVPIVSGVAVVVDFPLGARCADARMPPGMLVAVDTTGAHADPGETDLGARTVIVYTTAAELAALFAGA